MHWTEFPQGLTVPDVIATHDTPFADLIPALQELPDGAVWAPALFDPPRRRKRNVTGIHALVLDVDAKHERNGTIDDAIAGLRGTRASIHTTKSHTDQAHSFRIIIAVPRSMSPKEYRALWDTYRARLESFDVRVDEGAKDESRIWFPPARDAHIYEVAGDPVAIDSFLPVAGKKSDRRLADAVEKIRCAREGERNKTLYGATKGLQSYVVRGSLALADVVAAVTRAASDVGLADAEISSTIESATKTWPKDTLRPIVLDGGDFGRVMHETCDALTEIPGIFQRARQLVRVVGDRQAAGADVRVVTTGWLREGLCDVRKFVKMLESGPRPVWPPDALLIAVLDRAEWPQIPVLEGIVEAPTIRADGELVLQNGFDAQSGYLVASKIDAIDVPFNPTQQDAAVALETLLEPFADFPFERREHLSAIVAAILTVIARPAIGGRIPIFVIDANIRGSGKTLVCCIISIIARGREPALKAAPESNEEFDKFAGAILLECPSMVILDNVAHSLRLPSFDSLVTANIFSTRLLGANRTIEAQNRTVFLINGNNVELAGDLSRRAIPARLSTSSEAPERRNDFRIDDLCAHVHAHRAKYVGAALTILRAHALAGRPQGIPPLGGFQPWSRVIAAAIEFAGGANPIDARDCSDVIADRDAETCGALLAAWEAVAKPAGETTRAIILRLYAYQGPGAPPGYDDLREAIEAVALPSGRSIPTARLLGRFISTHAGRVIRGRQFIAEGMGHAGLRKWRVVDGGGLVCPDRHDPLEEFEI